MQNDVLLNFSDEGRFSRAINRLRNRGVKISEYYTPRQQNKDTYDSHTHKKSRIAGICAGAIGALSAFLLQLFLQQNNLTVNIGHTQLLPTSTFLPLIIEAALLFSGAAMFFTYRFSPKKESSLLSILPDTDKFYILCTTDSEDSVQAVEEVKKEAV